MRLHQLKIDFDAEQDRMLMLIAASEQVEVRMWLTRRFVKLLWPLLVKLAEEGSPRIRTQSNPEARKALLSIEHEQAVSKANFSQPYDDSIRATPLGAEPLLHGLLYNADADQKERQHGQGDAHQPAQPVELNRRHEHQRTRRSGRSAVEHLGDQGGDGRPFRARQGDVREERVALERLDHAHDAVVPADPKVVALTDVVREHNSAAATETAERGEQHRPFEVLCLIDDDEAVGEAPSADVREREHFEQPPIDDLVDHLASDHRLERIGDRRAPR